MQFWVLPALLTLGIGFFFISVASITCWITRLYHLPPTTTIIPWACPQKGKSIMFSLLLAKYCLFLHTISCFVLLVKAQRFYPSAVPLGAKAPHFNVWLPMPLTDNPDLNRFPQPWGLTNVSALFLYCYIASALTLVQDVWECWSDTRWWGDLRLALSV